MTVQYVAAPTSADAPTPARPATRAGSPDTSATLSAMVAPRVATVPAAKLATPVILNKATMAKPISP